MLKVPSVGGALGDHQPKRNAPMNVWQVMILFAAAMILSVIAFFSRIRKDD